MALGSIETQELVHLCRSGDEAAWSALVRRYSGYVHTVIRRVFSLPKPDAEEVFQKVWLRVYARLDTLRDDEALRAWVRQVTLNVARDHLAAGPEKKGELLVESVGPLPVSDESLDELDEALAVHELLAELPDTCRHILTRRFVDDEKYATIAGGLGLSVGQVSGTIHRCLGRLRKLLERAGR